MRRLSRPTWLLIGIGALLVVGTLLLQLATPASNDANLPRGTTLSAAPTGSLALSQWLEAEGYGVERVREFPFSGNDLAALFVIAPSTTEMTADDATDIVRFVEGGGTLFLATDGNDDTDTLQEALDLVLTIGKTGSGATAAPTGPSLARPPVATVALQSETAARPQLQNDPRFLARAADENGTVVATLTRGQGRVHLIAGPYPLSNAGLPEADNLALVQNLLAGLPAGARIGFDEYHHGYGAGTSIADLALRSPWGWAFFYLAALTLVAFILRGRRFGRPLPAPPPPSKPTAEYARALGDRWRERAQRPFAQAHIADHLKQGLAARFDLDPAADDATFLNALHRRRPDLAAECAALLRDLRTPAKDDAALVALAERAETFSRALDTLPIAGRAA